MNKRTPSSAARQIGTELNRTEAKGTARLAVALAKPSEPMTLSGTREAFKCPTNGLRFSPKDLPTLWIVKYTGATDPKDGKKYTGDIGVFMGEDAESNARNFAAVPSLLKACKELTEACENLPASDGRVIGLLPLLARARAALALATKGGE